MASAADCGADASQSGSCSGLADAGDGYSAVSFPELPARVSGGGGGDFVVWGEDKAERREIDASGSCLLGFDFPFVVFGSVFVVKMRCWTVMIWRKESFFG